MSTYKMVASTSEVTVLAEYVPQYSAGGKSYQSEAELEQSFIKQLGDQGYEYVQIHNEAALIANLRRQLEKLNDYSFSDDEWQRFFSQSIAGANEGVLEKTEKMQKAHQQVLIRDNGMTKNIILIDKSNVHNNSLQVINQYEEDRGNYKNRYDVTVLVNGLPLVHVELKRRGVNIREAFRQIDRYRRDSFWAASGLFEYVQIFVISNGTNSKYYSNTTRSGHIKASKEGRAGKGKKSGHAFEFTSFWADANNKPIADLTDFTRTFFAKHTLLNVLTKYCVFTAEKTLMVMRPYQIAATERILMQIEMATSTKKYGGIEGGGYIWHTTGSGKTLTSFKTAQLATNLEYIDKVLFVVDRKDLDYQTIREYDSFQKGAANSNTSTKILKKQLEDSDAKIIITTIQKLDRFIVGNKGHEVFKKHMVIIFDECHRSQFGEMHQKIIRAFKKYHLFGFTGTPIFPKNAPAKLGISTTAQAFGRQLHTYTIVDAINDGNVLPFRIDYVNTVKMKEEVEDWDVSAIDRERALASPRRIEKVVEYILGHFDQKTKRNHYYTVKERRLAGFNSIFAVSSIPLAMKYYSEFKRQQALTGQELKVAIIYSFSPNEDLEDPTGLMPDEELETDALDQTSREFLESAIADYNAHFNVNYDTTSDKFENYYKDLSQKVKDREVDILIVVNMFLTGFDAKTLNTLWVDKNLRQHGLIQAFSRTNRILNSVKTFGNIVCFRDLSRRTDEAIALFGDPDAGGIVLLKDYDSYYYGYEDEKGQWQKGYSQMIDELKQDYPLGEQIVGEQKQKDFIKLFGGVLRSVNILSAFDKFEGNEILSEREEQDYRSVYIDTYEDLKRSRKEAEKEAIEDDLVFEMELVRQVEVNIDYILMLVAKYHQSNCQDKEILVSIGKAVDSSLQLRSKKELIQRFVEGVNASTEVEGDWRRFVAQQKEEDLEEIMQAENLKEDLTRSYVENAFRNGELKTSGTEFDRILPPMSRFGGGNREQRKQGIIEKLLEFFEKYFGLI